VEGWEEIAGPMTLSEAHSGNAALQCLPGAWGWVALGRG